MPFSVTTKATLSPFTLNDVKRHLNIDDAFSDDDSYLEILINVAADYVENYTRRALLTQTIMAKYDCFPDFFEVERPLLQAVTSISYIDTNGDSQTLNSAAYTVDTTSTPPRIVESYGYNWPSTRDIVNAVTVVYVAGYDSADAIPIQIKHAMLLMIGDLYENRENNVAGVSIKEQTFATHALLSPYVICL